MTHKLRALSLALLALFATSALAASAAQAQGVLTNKEATELTITQDESAQDPNTGLQQLSTTSGSVQCKGVHAEVTGLTPNSTLTGITAKNVTYTECCGPFCEDSGVEFGECDYNLTLETTIGATGMQVTGKTHIECPTGKQITITGLGGFCQIHIPAQKPGGHLITNTITGATNHLTAEMTVTGITYQGTGLCTSGTNGAYKGNLTIKGFKKTPHEAAQQTSIEVH